MVHQMIALPELLTFEAIVVILTVGKVNVVLFAIYRPGSQLVFKAFFQELTSILENIMLLSDHVILLGDLNVHIEKNDHVNAKILSNVFDMFSMQDVIKEPTHMHGGTLDLVVPVINMPVTRVRVYPSGVISDHSLVVCQYCKVKEHQVFSNFLECSSDDVKAVILKAPPTTCMLDPILTSLFKKHIELFLPYLTDLINMCLKTGSYPMIFKKAIVTPLLKQPSSDANELKSFRPMSNLSFIAKIVEKLYINVYKSLDGGVGVKASGRERVQIED
ncbi:hypothetical protein HELRODRAFT_162453 [Helobdella robusta]|uniref:Endonuclease/exonuclease/phosphatase domain-containing protein n=1 Tax=Helobdella robusta TaxID=6412 RepID=T1ESP2_HELRO|nr:hypothetical protein HELRODRAFT_162453 [Helobdella robusta]ESN98980.1 hypothetical protein HELRODRAFT_162453 [Helobdella robusta]